MIVRRETPADRAAVRSVHVQAFASGSAEPVEARLVDELRGSSDWLPALSWVAERDEQVIAHAVCSRGNIDGTSAVALGPIAVAPHVQGGGVGSALLHALIGAADAIGEPAIALLGNPDYYRRFGFVTATDVGISPPEEAWGPHFQVRRLTAWSEALTGTFRYPAAFDGLE